jgi:hypothetical protein
MTALKGYPTMRISTLAAAAAVLLLAACQDLDVTNPNNPDRDRATSQPGDVQTLVASTFTTFWPMTQGNWPGITLSAIADEATSGFADFGILELSSEPRAAFNNTTIYSRRFLSENPWYILYSVISTNNDALAAIDGGLTIMEGTTDQTPRARAFAKFMQGIAHGYLGLYFDQASISDETMDPTTASYPLVPSGEVLAAAVSQLEAAAQLASANSFTIPASGWINGVTLSNQDLARIANTFIAKFLAYGARTPAERQAVDWNRVISHIDAGITADVAPEAIPSVLFSDYRRLMARKRTVTPGDFSRLDNHLVGPSDTSGAFQTWLNTPVAARNPFQLQTADRRIHAAGSPGTLGKYFGYHTATLYAADRGLYHRSRYYYWRAGFGESWQNGVQQWLTRTEMDLLKAEALIRLNRAAEAIPFINLSRVANGELPPITTVDGPAQAGSCVPRKFDGQCGSLWDALKYEKRIEMTGVEPAVSWYDGRGWGTLIEGSMTQIPIPARERETTQQPSYTFGGAPGSPGSAAAPNHNACPVTLPRCS